MILPTKIRASALGTALAFGLIIFSQSSPVFASPTFPPAMQKALSKLYPSFSFCVPQCTACHKTTEGGPGNDNVFGINLLVKGHLVPTKPDSVEGALKTYFDENPGIDSDKDGISDLTELEAGDSPSVPLPRGVGEFCPDIKYGCGARIAHAAPPSVDRIGLISAGLLVLGLSVFRRRVRRSPPR